MRKFLYLLAAMTLTLSGCSSSSGGDGGPQAGAATCTNDAQKQFVLDAMRDVYFWYTALPANVDLSQFATPEEFLTALISFSPINPLTNEPIDRFSFINSAEADAQFFGEGKFEGFGFSFRFEAADDLRFTRVFSGSPADLVGGFARGQRIIALDGRSIADIQANEGVGVVFGQSPLESQSAASTTSTSR